MFQTQLHAFDDIFACQPEIDQVLTALRSHFPTSRRVPALPSVQVHQTPDEWRVEIPLPGVDPRQVAVDVLGHTVVVRAEDTRGRRDGELRYERSFAVPQFLDLSRATATHRHGLLEVTLPLKESVKPRRIPVDGIETPQRQLTTA